MIDIVNAMLVDFAPFLPYLLILILVLNIVADLLWGR